MVSDLIDITICDDGRAVAAFQIRNTEGLDVALATALVRDDAGGAAKAGVHFLGIASQDSAFLWDLEQPGTVEEAAAWELPMGEYLRPYLAASGISGRLRHAELELLVFNWLSDLLYGEGPAEADPKSPLVASGFLGALKGRSLSLSFKTAA